MLLECWNIQIDHVQLCFPKVRVENNTCASYFWQPSRAVSELAQHFCQCVRDGDC